MKKIIIIIISAVIFSLIWQGNSFCGWGDVFGSYSTPLPAGAKEVAKEKAFMLGSDFTITIYDLADPFSEISKFYTRRLLQDGWEKQETNEDVKGELASISNVSLPATFKKGTEVIIVADLGKISDMTRFSISRGELYYLKTKENLALRDPEEVQFKDIPAYPGASVVPLSSMVSPLRIQVGYTTGDAPEEVVDFYRHSLALTGWTVEEELPLTNHDPRILKESPNLGKISKDMVAKTKSFSADTTGIRVFKGNDVCTIGVVGTKVSGRYTGETMISISVSKVRK